MDEIHQYYMYKFKTYKNTLNSTLENFVARKLGFKVTKLFIILGKGGNHDNVRTNSRFLILFIS